MNVRYPTVMHTWMFGNMPLADIFCKVKAAGFDGVDLSISNDESYSVLNYKTSDVQKLAAEYGLNIPVASALMKGSIHDLSQSDAALRQTAVDFVKAAVDATHYAGVRRLLVMPSRIFNTTYHVSRQDDWKQAVASLQICAEYAAGQDVELLLEPLNRQRVTLVRNLHEGRAMIEDVGLPNVFLVPDVYQMSMEEPWGIAGSIHQYGPWIHNLHVADSTRHAPGMGVYNWGEILAALHAIQYDGPLSFEPVFRDFDAALVATDAEYERRFLERLKIGVDYINLKMTAMSYEENL